MRLNDGLREVQCCHALLSTCLAPDPALTHLVTTHTRVQVLADPQMRREVVPGLPLHRVCQLLERFQPDENAPDPLLPGQLTFLFKPRLTDAACAMLAVTGGQHHTIIPLPC